MSAALSGCYNLRSGVLTLVDLLFRGRGLVFESPHSIEEVSRRLEREVTPLKWQLYDTRHHLFEGTVSAGRFRMLRHVRGRNSFRPVIEGVVSAARAGARIDVQLRMHPLVIGVLAIVFGIGALVALVAVSEALSLGELTPMLLVLPGLIVAVSGVLLAIASEARKATRLLAGMFEAAPRSADAAS